MAHLFNQLLISGAEDWGFIGGLLEVGYLSKNVEKFQKNFSDAKNLRQKYNYFFLKLILEKKVGSDLGGF